MEKRFSKYGTQYLKIALSCDLTLSLPDLDDELIVTSDASNCCFGAVLEQERDNKRRTIDYFSKFYTKAQSNYCTSEQELMSMVILNWR